MSERTRTEEQAQIQAEWMLQDKPAIHVVEDWTLAICDAVICWLEYPPLWLQITYWFLLSILIAACGLFWALGTPDTIYPR